ncbi:MAG: hypothetical protein ACPGO7_00150 [Alphaproteobacteria bacterium]
MQILFNAAFGALLLLSGWILRTIWDAVSTLKADLAEIERQLPSNYVRRDDYKDDIAEIKEFLREIFNKLDNKADK